MLTWLCPPGIRGPLFFASVAHFQEKFDIANDPGEIVVDFQESRVFDHSGIEAINKLTERYSKVNKKVRLKHLSEDCRRLLDNAGKMIEVNHLEDPHYKVADDSIG